MNGFDRWIAALEARQLADLTFQEVSRSLRALSSTYVERRTKLSEGAALVGHGKRAAFALFYGPLHYLLVGEVVRALGAPFTHVQSVLDLGCGTGASGAGWVTACAGQPSLTGIDRHPWAIDEARKTCADLSIRGTLRVDDLTRVGTHGQSLEERPGGRRGGRSGSAQAGPPHGRAAKAGSSQGSRSSTVGGRPQPNPATGRGVLLAFAVNEIADAAARDRVRDRLLAHGASGGRVIVIEPLAGFVAPWWQSWASAFEAAGGRADEWKFRVPLPAIVEKLDRAAGLNHRELKARSLAL